MLGYRISLMSLEAKIISEPGLYLLRALQKRCVSKYALCEFAIFVLGHNLGA